jgi:nucleoside-diphosphate-sugar epimerase
MIFDAIYKGLAYYTRGVTGYVDVRDVVECMIQLMQSDISGERFILNAANLSFQDMFNKVLRR